jgi:hypothetical protein
VSAQRPLASDGKPMRALRALVDTTAAEPATEYDVYRSCQAPGAWAPDDYHNALAALVRRELAARCPAVYRPAQWYITDAGRTLLSS